MTENKNSKDTRKWNLPLEDNKIPFKSLYGDIYYVYTHSQMHTCTHICICTHVLKHIYMYEYLYLNKKIHYCQYMWFSFQHIRDNCGFLKYFLCTSKRDSWFYAQYVFFFFFFAIIPEHPEGSNWILNKSLKRLLFSLGSATPWGNRVP